MALAGGIRKGEVGGDRGWLATDLGLALCDVDGDDDGVRDGDSMKMRKPKIRTAARRMVMGFDRRRDLEVGILRVLSDDNDEEKMEQVL